MNSTQTNLIQKLSLIHPDEFDCMPSVPVKNELFDESIEFKSGFISPDISPFEIPSPLAPPSPPSDDDLRCENKETDIIINNINIGNGKMKYIKDDMSREMLENAWIAINMTENWYFVSQPIDSFIMSTDKRICEITEKMGELGYNGHTGFTFGCTMRNMQFLAQKGIDKFMEIW